MSRDKIFIGTSGWTYDDWQGRFYPDDVRRANRLSFYAQQFNAVEVNATFYRLPTANMVQAWNRRLGGGFRLVLKHPETPVGFVNCWVTRRRADNQGRGILSTVYARPRSGTMNLVVVS